jgi:hypothetical protein
VLPRAGTLPLEAYPVPGMIFHKGEKNILFNKSYWENRIFTCRRLKLDPVQKSIQNVSSLCET